MKQIIGFVVVTAVVSSALTGLLVVSLRPPSPPPGGDPAVAALTASLEEARDRLKALQEKVDGVHGSVPAQGTNAAGAGLLSAGGAPGGTGEAAGGAAAAGGGTAPPAEGGVQPAPAAVEVEEVEEEPEESDYRKQSREAAVSRASALTERLREAARWNDSPSLRQKWLLAPEAEVVAAFGKPDEIYANKGEEENWIYDVPTGTTDEKGREEWDNLTVVMNRGRLIRVSD